MTTKTRKPPAPKHLSPDAKKLWASILSIWAIVDSANLAVLQAGLEARDRADKARLRINRDGVIVKDRFGQDKPHPLLPAERDNRAAFLAALKQLGLEPPTE